MRVLLARHGQTEWNVLGRRQGQLDSPLTAAGWDHARRHAKTLAPQDIDAIFTSPLGRASTTADIIGEALGVPVTAPTEDPAESLRRKQPHEVIYAVADRKLTTLGTPA
jgi:probable phosphoglycerate mutase